MHAVLVRSTIHDREEATNFLREQAIPRFSQAPGFLGGQWVRLEGGSGTGMVTFASEAAAQAAVELLRNNPPPESAVTLDTVEVGEVVERV
jgi:hypothetical protein